MQMTVDAVEEWPRDASPIAGNGGGRAATGQLRVIGPTARAGVHGGDKLKFCGKHHAVACASDCDRPSLERFAQEIESLARKFGELIQK